MKTKLNTKPEMEFEHRNMCNLIVKIDNPYLQAWADAGAYVMCSAGYWIMTSIGQLWFKIEEDGMHLECIAVNADDRRQGNGSKLMELVIQFADETGIPVTLQVDNVTQGGFIGGAHPVVGCGQNKKNKIPVASLPKWYQKFGFTKSPSYTAKKRNMNYQPKTK